MKTQNSTHACYVQLSLLYDNKSVFFKLCQTDLILFFEAYRENVIGIYDFKDIFKNFLRPLCAIQREMGCVVEELCEFLATYPKVDN